MIVKNWMIGIVGLLTCQCSEAKEDFARIVGNVEVIKGAKEVNPAKRKLKKIGELDEEGKDVLVKFLEDASMKSYSFVLSEFYLRCHLEDGSLKTFGVVIKSDGSLLGLDVTGVDASTTSVRSKHSVLTSQDKVLSEELRRLIALRAKEQPSK